jgi:hypothetical protein
MRILFSCSVMLCLLSGNCLADPTRPAQLTQSMPSAASKSSEPIRLSLIRWQEQQASVVINGQLMKIGDTIAGYQLREVHQDHVVLESAADRLQLFIFQKMTHNDK